jgi:NAD(P)-dependent dehydrogenase (short-subunit alcohol dehydrogenase family)
MVRSAAFVFSSLARCTVTTGGFTNHRMLHPMPDDAWDIIMKVHVRAPFRLTRAAAPFMRIKAEPGMPSENLSIIKVSSITGLHASWAKSVKRTTPRPSLPSRALSRLL